MKNTNNDECEVIELIKQLISIKSSYFNEKQIMEFVNNWFHENGIESYIHEYADEKVTKFHGQNVVLELNGNKPGPVICLNGHLDTVKLCKGWTVDPYSGEIIDGRIYGVGALDMKSGCCAIMLATKKFAKKGKNFAGKLIVTLVSDEEGPYGLGTNALIEDGLLENVDFSIVGEPSAAFVGKPFPLICLGAKGGYGLEIEIYGKSAHAAVPDNGLNATDDASKIVCALKNIEPLNDELLGRGVLCVVGIESDGGACSVPDYAKIKIFRHTVRGEDESLIIDELKKAISSANIKCDYSINFREAPSENSKGFMPYTVDPENKYVKAFADSIEETCNEKPSIGYLQSIGDFNYLGTRIGAPVVLFGASGHGLHSNDEYVEIDSIEKTADSIYNFLEKIYNR